MMQCHFGRTRAHDWVLAPMLASGLGIAGCGAGLPIKEDGTDSIVGNSHDDRPPRPDNKEACNKCGGLWGVHGIVPIESCICRTRDGGRSCTNGSDCEGACIVGDEASFDVVTPGDPPLGFFVGRCADYDTTFGCYRVVPPRGDETSPLPEDNAAQDICVD